MRLLTTTATSRRWASSSEIGRASRSPGPHPGGNAAPIYRGGGMRTDITVASGSVVDGVTYLAGSSTIQNNAVSDSGGGIWARARQTGVPVDPSAAFRVAGGSESYTGPLTGATLPAW